MIAARDLREVAKFCKEELSFDYLLDISSVDNFGDEPRFEIVYELYSMTLAVHLRLKLRVSEDDPTVDTVSDIWPTANWHEREIYDMMGLRFNGHPDLRRILMWDGYPYFPVAQRIPARRSAERHARCRLHLRRADGRRPLSSPSRAPPRPKIANRAPATGPNHPTAVAPVAGSKEGRRRYPSAARAAVSNAKAPPPAAARREHFAMRRRRLIQSRRPIR